MSDFFALPFRDRRDAGRRLAAALAEYRQRDCLVLALPRGGVPVADEVARALAAPLDLLLVRKIGAPGHPEFAVGAVVDGGAPIVVRNKEGMRALDVDEGAFQAVCAHELKEIERRRRLYLRGSRPLDPKGHVVIVIDDGIATGATVRAALQAVRKRDPEKLILAVPVAPREALTELRGEADEIVCLAMPRPFGAVGYFYDDFRQVSDAEVIAIMARYRTDLAREGAEQ
ncbi:MAG TPA: phosphoribosyltransferase family protein [Rhizomicrobium sp.]|nr:phosphoribosyltransferase family protein [Rhizomicrobium sp.]